MNGISVLLKNFEYFLILWITLTYTGLTRNTFKRRFSAHKYSFNHRGENSTTLSMHLWKLKDENTDFTIKWNIIDRASEFNPTTRKCRLCDKEKYYIIFEPDGANLNLRSELFSTCRHRLRLLLNNTWSPFLLGTLIMP